MNGRLYETRLLWQKNSFIEKKFHCLALHPTKIVDAKYFVTAARAEPRMTLEKSFARLAVASLGIDIEKLSLRNADWP